MGKAVDKVVALSTVKGFVRHEHGKLAIVGAYDRGIDTAARDLKPGDMIYTNGELHRVDDASADPGNSLHTVVTTTHIHAVHDNKVVVSGPKKKAVDRDSKITVLGHAPKGNHKAIKSVWRHVGPRKSNVGRLLVRKIIPGHRLHILSLAASLKEQGETWNNQQPYDEGSMQHSTSADLKDNAFMNATKRKAPTKITEGGNDVWLHGSKTGAANVTTTENGVAIHHGSIEQKGDKFVANPNGNPKTTHGSVSDALHHVMEMGQPITEKTYKQMATKPDVTGGNA